MAERNETNVMIDLIQKFFTPDPGPAKEASDAAPVHDIRVATCALMLEMANIDGEFNDQERQQLFAILKKEYGLGKEVAEQIEEAARAELKDSIDLWRFTNLINENYSEEEKLKVIEMVWRIVYADGKLDMHEDYLVHKLATLLKIEHRHLVAAKLEVLKQS
ncbi:MAG: TerB family tellurite resistance protein [bacterium]